MDRNGAVPRNLAGFAPRDGETSRILWCQLARLQEAIAAEDCCGALIMGRTTPRERCARASARPRKPSRATFVSSSSRRSTGSVRTIRMFFPNGRRAAVRSGFCILPQRRCGSGLPRPADGGTGMLPGDDRIALDIAHLVLVHALMAEGLDVFSADRLVEMATLIRNEDETELSEQMGLSGDVRPRSLQRWTIPSVISTVRLW